MALLNWGECHSRQPAVACFLTDPKGSPGKCQQPLRRNILVALLTRAKAAVSDTPQRGAGVLQLLRVAIDTSNRMSAF